MKQERLIKTDPKQFFLKAKISIMHKCIKQKQDELQRSFDPDVLKEEIKELRYCIKVAENQMLYSG